MESSVDAVDDVKYICVVLHIMLVPMATRIGDGESKKVKPYMKNDSGIRSTHHAILLLIKHKHHAILLLIIKHIILWVDRDGMTRVCRVSAASAPLAAS